jgi:A/G-specific adenine glycosylase
MTAKRASSPCAVWPEGVLDQQSFCELVRAEGATWARPDLPWRNTCDAYGVLVSEVMLQQTQVKRVLSFWPRFMESFPTLEALAVAPTSEVLSAWQGLGYNRRALALKRTAEECVAAGLDDLPDTYEGLLALPGIGPATAAGVQAFARNRWGVYLETNVRTVFLHLLFPGEVQVSDKRLEPLVAMTCPENDARGWYYALLDFGAHLKRQVANPSRRSASYTRQSAFSGSRRQKRAELVRIVLDAPGISVVAAHRALNDLEIGLGRPEVQPALFESILADLVSEGFFKREGGGSPEDRLLP